MTRFPLHLTPRDPHLANLYRDIVDSGFGTEQPINFFTALGSRTDLLQATWAFVKAVLVDGQLPGSVKQMIALCVSRQNNCRYCSVVHRGALEAAGVDSEIIESCATDPETRHIKEPQRSIVQFALKAARDPSSIADGDVTALLDKGLTHGEVTEVIVMAGFTNFINSWADISGIPLDGEGE
ncbi:MAG: carboxymuconolactone decarboxylase family protein [Proteobacteria bacterium]|nr:carboxymuconolactone decarboxylase family protein [Pseudomonadota bacterium]